MEIEDRTSPTTEDDDDVRRNAGADTGAGIGASAGAPSSCAALERLLDSNLCEPEMSLLARVEVGAEGEGGALLEGGRAEAVAKEGVSATSTVDAPAEAFAMKPHLEWPTDNAWSSLPANDGAADSSAGLVGTELMSAVDATKDQSYFLCQVLISRPQGEGRANL